MTPREAALRDSLLWQQAYRAAGRFPTDEEFAEANELGWRMYHVGAVPELGDYEAVLSAGKIV